MKRITILFLLIGFLTGCATTAPLRSTASGFPEADFYNTNMDVVQNKIAEYCNTRGFNLEIVNQNTIKCSQDITRTGAGMLYAALTTPQYATNPHLNSVFTMFKTAKGIKVTTNVFVESQNAFGQVKRNEVRNNETLNVLQQRLYDMGGK